MAEDNPFAGWIGTAEAAALLNIKIFRVRQWIMIGLLPAVRFDRYLFMRQADVEALGRRRDEERRRIESQPPPRRELIRRVRERTLRSLAKLDPD